MIPPALNRRHNRLTFFTLNLQIVHFKNELKISVTLPSNFEIFITGSDFIDSSQFFFKKSYSYKLMVENKLNKLVQGCKLLKFKFVVVLAADNFPVNLSHSNFIIVNVWNSQQLEHIGHLFVEWMEIMFCIIPCDII